MVRSILFFDTKGACGIWGLRWFDVSFRELFFHSFMHEFGLWGTEEIYFTLKGVGGVRFQINGMIVFSP
jgi:hypothetical protein